MRVVLSQHLMPSWRAREEQVVVQIGALHLLRQLARLMGRTDIAPLLPPPEDQEERTEAIPDAVREAVVLLRIDGRFATGICVSREGCLLRLLREGFFQFLHSFLTHDGWLAPRRYHHLWTPLP